MYAYSEDIEKKIKEYVKSLLSQLIQVWFLTKTVVGTRSNKYKHFRN